jgi:hypothetical protein
MKDHPKIDWKALKRAKFIYGSTSLFNPDFRV